MPHTTDLQALSEDVGIEPPLCLEESEIAWDEAADVVVVGFGGAGVSAAIEAREHGAAVLALDRFAGGGATAYSGGVIYAGGTRVQAEAGFADSAEAMFRYLSMEVGEAVTPTTLRRFCDGSAADLEWLIRHGVVFNRKAMTAKTAYPPDAYSLYYSGNEKAPRYKAQADPAPRGHRAVGKGFTGYAFFAPLRSAALEAGVRFIPHAPVRRLIVNRKGEVLGVEAQVLPQAAHAAHAALYAKAGPTPFTADKAEAAIRDCRAFERAAGGERRRVRAYGGVILSAGGFVFNLQMLRQHRPILAENYRAFLRMGSMGDDGSGIRLGQSVGGSTAMLENIFINKLIAPPDELLKGVAVNRDGERFINEDCYCGFLGDAIARQAGGAAWLVLDRRGFWRVVRQCLRTRDRDLFKLFLLPTLLNILRGGARSAFSLGRLAGKIGVDPAKLVRTVAAYNDAASAGDRPDPLGKSPEHVRPIAAAPFYAVNLSLANPMGFVQLFSLSGLRVREDDGAVLGQDDHVVPGLYAAGRTAVGLCSQGYLSGMSLADCVFSGRRAGASATVAAQAAHRGVGAASMVSVKS